MFRGLSKQVTNGVTTIPFARITGVVTAELDNSTYANEIRKRAAAF